MSKKITLSKQAHKFFTYAELCDKKQAHGKIVTKIASGVRKENVGYLSVKGGEIVEKISFIPEIAVDETKREVTILFAV